mmetsp:Transcript_22039/g.42299  ORF Transcript_22039/g.42299 Transcript_22039/m.42299 type:complete len:428 (-) Transcript_22039:107-1390(-)
MSLQAPKLQGLSGATSAQQLRRPLASERDTLLRSAKDPWAWPAPGAESKARPKADQRDQLLQSVRSDGDVHEALLRSMQARLQALRGGPVGDQLIRSLQALPSQFEAAPGARSTAPARDTRPLTPLMRAPLASVVLPSASPRGSPLRMSRSASPRPAASPLQTTRSSRPSASPRPGASPRPSVSPSPALIRDMPSMNRHATWTALPMARVPVLIPVQAPLAAAVTSKLGRERRVLLMRHGESEGNISRRDVPDPYLTWIGVAQAKSWEDQVGEFGAEVVLISPLRRAMQTACLAFGAEDVPMELCRDAREFGWRCQENTILSTPEELPGLLAKLPRGAEVKGVQDALKLPSGNPSSEVASLVRLRRLLWERPEEVVMVVCHYGVINALCGCNAKNCEVLDCRWQDDRTLKAVARHKAPFSQNECMCT